LIITFFFLLILFSLTAALFESFHDPLIILISFMSICGAMIFISLGVGGASLNIYTEVVTPDWFD